MMYVYVGRQRSGPGCCGLFFLLALLVLLFGGFPALINFLGVLATGALLFLGLLAAGYVALVLALQARLRRFEAGQTEAHREFVQSLVQVLVHVAQADGRFTRSELRAMLDFFEQQLHYDREQMFWVKQLIKEARHQRVPLEQLLSAMRGRYGYEARCMVVDLVYRQIFAKAQVAGEELEMAAFIARHLGVGDYDHQTIFAKYRRYRQREQAAASNREARYYAVLGLDEGADFAAIKRAYRQLSLQYHPDKVRHLGEEFRRVAEEKMKEINEAYDYFKRKFAGQGA